MAGLDRVSAGPVGKGWLEPKLVLSSKWGPAALVEAGVRPKPNLSLYGFGLWSRQEQQAGVGARFTF